VVGLGYAAPDLPKGLYRSQCSAACPITTDIQHIFIAFPNTLCIKPNCAQAPKPRQAFIDAQSPPDQASTSFADTKLAHSPSVKGTLNEGQYLFTCCPKPRESGTLRELSRVLGAPDVAPLTPPHIKSPAPDLFWSIGETKGVVRWRSG
jgi:hypothetical protein